MGDQASEVPEGFRRLPNSERRVALGARRTGPADPEERLSVTIVVRRRPDGPPLPGHEDFAAAPSPRQGRRSRPEFAELYGALPEDLDNVAAYARSRGLEVASVHQARRSVVVSGSVARMNAAFGVDLGRYESADAVYRGREGAIHVPAHLAEVVEGVFGLDNRNVSRTNGPSPNPVNTLPLTPPQVAGLYEFPKNSAAGQTIGILSFGGGYRRADITAFLSDLGPAFVTPRIRDVSIDKAVNNPARFGTRPPTNADQENILDISVAASVAQGADLAVYFAPNSQQGWVDALARAIHPDPGDPEPTVLSISWYVANGDDDASLALAGVAPAWVDAVHACLHDAAIVGVTVVVASGDSGSFSKLPDGKAHVQYPASDPFALSVGGTAIGNVTAAGFQEVTWNDTASGFSMGIPNPAATGGGVSHHFDVPAWQAAAGIPASLNDPNRRGRGVPDVAGNASQASGYRLFIDLLKQPSQNANGGTSAAVPLYAGLIAIINAVLLEPVGFLNPSLYAFGARVVQDINDGRDNAITFTKPDGTTATSPAYRSGPGWDACTGLGRVSGIRLLTALQQLLGTLADHVVLDDRSDEGPALASHNGRLFMAFRGSGNTQLNLAVSEDDGHNFRTTVLPDSSELSPALTSHNGRLLLAWVGRGNERLNVATVEILGGPGGVSIGNLDGHVQGDTSDRAPALASHAGRLFLAWKGSGNRQLNVAVSDDGGATFPGKKVLSDTTDESPALASHDEHLKLAWAGEDAHLNVATVTVQASPGSAIGDLTGHMVTAERSGEGPALASHDGRLYLAWQGPNEPRVNAIVSNDNGGSFHGKQIFSDTTEQSPALASHNDRLFIAWPGEGGHHLNVMKLTPPPFTEDTLERTRALMDFAAALLASSQSGSGTGPDAQHDLQTALQALQGLAPPPFLAFRYRFLLLAILRALDVALLGAGRTLEALGVTHQGLSVAEQAAATPGGNLLDVVPFWSWFAGLLVTLGVPAEAVDAQQRVVDLLAATTPDDADRLAHSITLALARHDLVVRLLSAGRQAEAVALVPQVLDSYRAYATLPGADVLRVARELPTLDKQIQPTNSTALQVDIEQTAVDLLASIPPLPGSEVEHRLLSAETLHNLMLRLRADNRPAEAASLPPRIIAGYRQYAAAAGIDLPRLTSDLQDLVGQLRAAGFDSASTDAQQLLDQVSAP